MSPLALDPRWTDGDAFYAELVDALDAAGDEGATRLLARLALILGNQIGDQDVLRAALALAQENGPPRPAGDTE